MDSGCNQLKCVRKRITFFAITGVGFISSNTDLFVFVKLSARALKSMKQRTEVCHGNG